MLMLIWNQSKRGNWQCYLLLHHNQAIDNARTNSLFLRLKLVEVLLTKPIFMVESKRDWMSFHDLPHENTGYDILPAEKTTYFFYKDRKNKQATTCTFHYQGCWSKIQPHRKQTARCLRNQDWPNLSKPNSAMTRWTDGIEIEDYFNL